MHWKIIYDKIWTRLECAQGIIHTNPIWLAYNLGKKYKGEPTFNTKL